MVDRRAQEQSLLRRRGKACGSPDLDCLVGGHCLGGRFITARAEQCYRAARITHAPEDMGGHVDLTLERLDNARGRARPRQDKNPARAIGEAGKPGVHADRSHLLQFDR